MAGDGERSVGDERPAETACTSLEASDEMEKRRPPLRLMKREGRRLGSRGEPVGDSKRDPADLGEDEVEEGERCCSSSSAPEMELRRGCEMARALLPRRWWRRSMLSGVTSASDERWRSR